MKILCAYYNPEEAFLDPDPAAEFPEHEIIEVHSYSEARRIIIEEATLATSIGVILADVQLPWETGSEDMIPSVLLQPHVFKSLIRGLGIFVPSHYESEFAFGHEEYYAIVADRHCWTPSGHRDWKKLFDMVLGKIDMIAA